MGVLFLPGALVAALALAIAGVSAPGSRGGGGWEVEAVRWILFLPLGWTMVVSGFMHTVLARSTAARIGWATSPFQYEVGFCSFGLGTAGIVSAFLGREAWIPIAIASSIFLLGAGVYHVVEIVHERNFAPGNTVVLLYDFGVPAAVWPLLLASGAVR
jgi:hypothetical protein